jgi:hypothetical protein
VTCPVSAVVTVELSCLSGTRGSYPRPTEPNVTFKLSEVPAPSPPEQPAPEPSPAPQPDPKGPETPDDPARPEPVIPPGETP